MELNVVEPVITNAELFRLAEQSTIPQEWYDEADMKEPTPVQQHAIDTARRAEADQVADLHEACKLMGWPCHSGDRFVRQAIEWLAGREEFGALSLAGDDDIGWSVWSTDFYAGGNTLIEALVGAIFTIKGENDATDSESDSGVVSDGGV